MYLDLKNGEAFLHKNFILKIKASMSKISSLWYKDKNDENRKLDFIANQKIFEGHHTTILTGHNGSYKSTILKEIVRSVVNPDQMSSKLKFVEPDSQVKDALHLIATSGAIADKFPAKENGGIGNEFDVPNYVYLGQRVGANLISKKQSLETAVTCSLNEKVAERFSWPFYNRAFEFAGIIPRLDLTFISHQVKFQANKPKYQSLLTRVTELAKRGAQKRGNSREISQGMAKYLLDEFTYEAFNELDLLLNSSKRLKIQLSLTTEIPFSNIISLEALRLGLLADLFSLTLAEVTSRRRRQTFSVFDLSSGEYHMLVTVLGLGFSLQHGSIVLVDEPENSLHPQWQVEFMKTLFEMCMFMRDGHIIVSTHSPLIVSSAKEGSTIIDLAKTGDSLLDNRSLFGASVDDILFDHFGVASSRNFFVVDKVQRAVNLFELGEVNGEEFAELKLQLRKIKVMLSQSDPLVIIIDALLEGEIAR